MVAAAGEARLSGRAEVGRRTSPTAPASAASRSGLRTEEAVREAWSFAHGESRSSSASTATGVVVQAMVEGRHRALRRRSPRPAVRADRAFRPRRDPGRGSRPGRRSARPAQPGRGRGARSRARLARLRSQIARTAAFSTAGPSLDAIVAVAELIIDPVRARRRRQPLIALPQGARRRRLQGRRRGGRRERIRSGGSRTGQPP